MKVISIGTDRKIFAKDSAVRRRAVKYGEFFEEMHVIVFSKRNHKHSDFRYQISNKIFAYPTNSKSGFFYIWDAFRIGKTLKSNIKNSSCVVSGGDPFETGAVGVLLKLFFNLPLHIQVHTDLMNKYFSQLSLLNRIRFFIAEFILRYSDRVRAVSERVGKSISPFSKSIDILPIKMEIEERNYESVKKPFPFTLLMVCRLEKEKNIETVFRAVKTVKNKDIGLCIVGDGSQKNNLENVAKNMGISEKIIFAGWQNNLAPYYKMADIFVSASLYEGYGISIMEAAYFGKPLILSETGIAGDIFKENESAFVCDAKDSACFAKNILEIYKDKDLAQKMGQLAKISADKHLISEKNYFKEYADSIIKTAANFKERNFISRIINFKITAFRSIRFLRYFICGIISAAVNIILLYIFTDIWSIWYLYSSIFAFLIALIVSFNLQKFVVFKDGNTDGLHRQFSKFFIAAVLGVISNTILVYVFTDIINVWYIFSQIIAGIFVMVQNFILYRFFIFNK
ncbi:MAG: glycosyltransferase [Candidatus Zambryskibacteria bacterium]